MKKRVLSLFLALTLCLTLLPTSAFAEGENSGIASSGTTIVEGGQTTAVGAPDEDGNPSNDGAVTEENGQPADPAPTPEENGQPADPAPTTEDDGQSTNTGEGEPSNSETDTRTEIWCKSKPDSIGRSYDGTTDGGTIPINLTFTDGTNEIAFKERTDFTAVKTFDSADAGWHTVTVEITLIGEAAAKYKLKAGEEKFEIGGNINKAYPHPTVSLSKTTCAVGEKLLPLLSVEGAPEDAEVTYYYLAAKLKNWAGSSDVEGGTSMPKIDEDTAISEPGTYCVYAKTGATKNYEENRSATVELTVSDAVVEAALVISADGTQKSYESLPAALEAAQDNDTVKLLANHTTDWDAVEAGEAQMAVVKKRLTLDLNGKTVDYLAVGEVVPDEAGGILESTDGYLTVMGSREGTGSIGTITTLKLVRGTLSVQDGANIGSSDASSAGLICEADSGAVTISGGTVYGANIGAYATVTVSGGSMHAGSWINDGGKLNITGGTFGSVKFQNNGGTIAISGGTFGTLQNFDDKSSQIPPMSLLKSGYAFYDRYNEGTVKDGSRVDFLQNVTVKEHTHTIVDGKCACGASSFVVTVTGSDGAAPVWYTSLDDALDAVKDGDTVTLQGDAEVTEAHWLRASFTLELNGKTATLQSGAQLSICAQSIIQDSSDGQKGKMLCDDYGTYILNVQGGALTIKSGVFAGKIAGSAGGTSKLTIEGGTFNKDVNLSAISASLSGGSFTSIWQPEGSFLDRLADGYAFYDKDGNLINAARNGYLNNVKVQKHEQHTFTDGACDCGYTCPHTSVGADGKCTVCNKQFAASVTVGEDVTYYDTFGSALSYATRNDGCTLKLLADVTGTTVMINNPFIFDLNGHNVDALSVDAKATIKDSGATKGKIGTLSIHNNTDPDSDALTPTIVLGDLVTGGDSLKAGDTWLTAAQLFGTSANNVSVAATGITGVTVNAPESVIYGQTGTTPITLTVTPEDVETLTYEWFVLKDNNEWSSTGTGGDAYNPAALNAGTHTIRGAVMSNKGWVLSNAVTVTVAKASIESAFVSLDHITFVYDGTAKKPTVTEVTIGGLTTLTAGTDYYVEVTPQTNVGNYSLTVNGMGNYSGKIENVAWKIEPKTVTNPSINVAPCVYNGFEQTPSVELKDGETVIPKEEYTVEYSDNINAGDGSLTIQDVEGGNYVVSGSTTFTIEQASINTSNRWIEVRVFNELAKTYEVELQPNLDNILYEQRIEGTFGTVTYSLDEDGASTYADYYELGTAKIENGKLILPIKNGSGVSSGNYIVTLMLKVESTNFKSFDLPVHIIARDKIVPRLAEGSTVSATDITYGQTLNESTLTVNGSMEAPSIDAPNTIQKIEGTFAWKNGTIKPNAGDYTASWTFTPAEGYEEYATATGNVTVKVNPAQLQNVSVLQGLPMPLYYTGQPQRAGVSAVGLGVCGERVTFTYSTTENGIYTSEVPAFTDAGTYTVYYKAEVANHVPATGTFSVQIKALPISLISVDKISKTYDGSANVTLTASRLTFISKTAKASDIKLPDTALTFTNAQFTKKQEDGSYLPSPEVGDGKALSYTMTLASDNYVFEGKPEGTKTISSVFDTDDTTRFTITKATAPTNIQPGTLNVINGTTLTYTYDSSRLLPDAPKGTYGVVFYGGDASSDYESEYKVDSFQVGISNGVLTLTIDAQNGGKTGKIGSVTIYVTTDNYETFSLPIDLCAINQITPVADGDITATEITYGDALSKSEISGKMKDSTTGEEITGTFTWKAGTIKPNAGDYQAEWTFTPAAGYEKYATATGNVTVKVNKADPTFSAPAANTLTYTGSEQPLLKAGSTQGGTMMYRLGESGEFVDSIPTGKDAGTYTVYYKVVGDGNHNDTAEQPITVTIAPKKLSPFVLGIDSLTKAYDGTASASLYKDEIEFRSNGAIVLLPEDAYDITNARFTMRADGSYKDSPEAGDGKSLSFTVTLKSDNYVFDGDEESKTLDCNIVAEDAKSFTITKATEPKTTVQPAVTVINGLAKTYELVLTDNYLPKLSSPCEYGSVSYSVKGTYLTDGYKDTVKAEIVEENGQYKLKLTVPAVDYDRESSVGTLDIKVVSGNYQDLTLTIGVKTKNRTVPVPDGTISATDITYGQTLSESSITGKMKDPDTGATVEGTFSWQYPDLVPDKAGTYWGDWKFTPKEKNTYTEAVGKVEVVVNNVKQSATLVMEGYTYGEKPSTPRLENRKGNMDAAVTYNYFSVDGSGTMQTWDIDDPPMLSAGTYTMRATIAGTQNYDSFTTTDVQFTVTKATPDFTSGTTYKKPTGLTAKYGQTLADVKLSNPEGNLDGTWSWMNSSESVGDASVAAKTFQAKFTPTDTKNYNTVENIELEVMVNKVDGGNLKTVDLTQKYTDTSEHTYTPDWSELPSGQKWSYNSEYSVSTGSNITLTKHDFTANGSLLTYAISGGKAGDKITLTLKASCGNYGDFTIKLNITLTEKDDQKPLTITGDTSVIYGEKLTLTTTGGSGTGAVTYRIDTAHSTGEATIDPNTGVLTPVKVGSVSVIATKAGDKDYNDITSAPFVLMVKPATPTGAPNYTKITTGGKTLKDAALTTEGSTLKPNGGKLEWVDDEGNILPDSTRVEANTTYKWRFTPTDTNYTTLTGEIELYHKSSGGGGSSGYSYYTIKATAGAGGSISPSGNVSVREGRDQTFTITPDKGYAVSNVKIDGKSIGAVKSYTFENVTGDHTIEVTFVKDTASANTGDSSNLPLWSALLLASTLTLAGTVRYKKKRAR